MGAEHVRASHELAELDPVIAALLERHGPMRVPARPAVDRRFASLARIIAHQQLAGRAAATIWARVEELVEDGFSAAAVLSLDPIDLRAAGLSGAKTASLIDLAHSVDEGRLDLRGLGRLRDSEVIERLVAIRGIGPWSAQMFLMHDLGRLDVWPTGDLGVRVGYARAFGTGDVPDPRHLEVLGEKYRPHRSVLAWYCWRAADDDGL